MFASDLSEGTTAEQREKKKNPNKLLRFRLMPPRWPGMKARLVATNPHGRFVVDSGFHSVSTAWTRMPSSAARLQPSIHPSIHPAQLWSSARMLPKYTDPVKKLTMCCSSIVPEFYCQRSGCWDGRPGISLKLPNIPASSHFPDFTCSFSHKQKFHWDFLITFG